MKSLSFVTIFVFLGVSVIAQNASIKGFVYDKENGEPLIGITVGIKGTSSGGRTDNDGFYSFGRLEPGVQVLVVRGVGYETQEVSVDLKENYTVSQTIYLVRKARVISDVVISSKRIEKKYDPGVGVTKISPKEVKLLPSIGGEADIAQYLQVIPGVISTGDQGGQLYIRGGSPVQNKILLDGMTIYNPFHSIGLYSVFETDAIRNVEVQSGGFGPEYGDRTSAIVNVTTKDGNKKRLSGNVGVNPILAKFFLEGPLMNGGEDGETSASFIANVKHSYLNYTSANLYGGLGEPYKSKLPFSFTDAYAKTTFNFKSGSKFSFFGFSFNDRVNFANVSDLQWNSVGGGTNFIVSPQGSSSLIDGGLYYSNYKIGLTEADNQPRQSSIGGFDANIGVTNYFANFNEFKYGIEFNGFRTYYNYYNNIGTNIEQNQYTTQLGVYFKGKKNFKDKLILEPGLRLQYYASVPVFRLEPRLALKYNITDNFRFKGATGMYSQNLISSKSDKDIVNFFTAFLTAPDDNLADRQGKQVSNNIQKSYHIIGGFELDVKKFEFTLEPWYKNFNQLIAINRYKLLSSEPDFLIETGKAYGVDFTAKYSDSRIFFWGVYSYGYVDRYDGEQTYPPPFDRRHNINLLGSYILGKKYDWTFSARFNYGSAFPFTLTQALYEKIDFGNGLGTNYLSQNGNMGILYDTKINGGRLSPYHRLDVSLMKKFALSTTSTLEVSAGVTNAYNQKNIFYIDRVRNTKEYQLPLFPSLGINWHF